MALKSGPAASSTGARRTSWKPLAVVESLRPARMSAVASAVACSGVMPGASRAIREMKYQPRSVRYSSFPCIRRATGVKGTQRSGAS